MSNVSLTNVEVLGRSELGMRILKKVLISLAIASIAYVVTELTGQPEIWSITLSVFVGGVTLVIQFLMEFEARLARVETAKERHSARIETMVADGFAKINTATRLFSLVESSALPTDEVIKLMQHATLIDPDAPRIAFDLAQTEIKRLSAFLKGLGDSEAVTYEGEDRDWLLALTRAAAGTIDATSYTTVDARGKGFADGGFWKTDLGLRYLDAQQEAIDSRKVRIRRVFVVLGTSASINDTDFIQVCRLHRQIGVEVRVLDPDTIPDTLLDMQDFVLFDDSISYEMTAKSGLGDPARPTMLDTRLVMHGGSVTNRAQHFRRLWESAQEFAS